MIFLMSSPNRHEWGAKDAIPGVALDQSHEFLMRTEHRLDISSEVTVHRRQVLVHAARHDIDVHTEDAPVRHPMNCVFKEFVGPRLDVGLHFADFTPHNVFTCWYELQLFLPNAEPLQMH